MCCFFLLLASLGPRFAIVAMWLFGSRVDAAFDSGLWPLLGLLLAPWTTLMYLLAWSPAGGVSGAEWLLVGLGVNRRHRDLSGQACQDEVRNLHGLTQTRPPFPGLKPRPHASPQT
jgi:hypothetical protein